MAEQELRSHFFILQIFGIWVPNFDSMILRGLYYLWRAIILLFMFTFLSSQIVDLCMQKNVEGMTKNFLLSTVMFCSILKVVLLLLKRREIIEMLNLLKLPFCLPITVAEHNILKEYRRHAWLIMSGFLLLCFITLLMQLTIPLVYGKGIEGRGLPYSTWQPYSIETIVSYTVTYMCLVLSCLISMPLSITSDCLISGFMVVACSHLEILELRLARLQTPTDVKICVQHHKIIFQFAKCIEEIFGPVVFIQFLLSMINICSIIFVIFQSESKAGSIASFFFLICMMIQLLLYCWNGNEVFLKSQSVTRASMDNTNWITLPTQMKKALLLIMVRSQQPVQMKAGWLLTLSLQTFMMIVKTSYSAFNLLQHASNDQKLRISES